MSQDEPGAKQPSNVAAVADEPRPPAVGHVANDQPPPRTGNALEFVPADLSEFEIGLQMRFAADAAKLKQCEQGAGPVGAWQLFELDDERAGKQQRFFQAFRGWDVR